MLEVIDNAQGYELLREFSDLEKEGFSLDVKMSKVLDSDPFNYQIVDAHLCSAVISLCKEMNHKEKGRITTVFRLGFKNVQERGSSFPIFAIYSKTLIFDKGEKNVKCKKCRASFIPAV